MKIIPADDVLAELEKKAHEYEEKAKTEVDEIATGCREKAKQCREWIAILTSGKWRSEAIPTSAARARADRRGAWRPAAVIR